MARDGNGTFTLPPGYESVTAGTDITADWANTVIPEIVDGLTDSLSRTGQGGMDPGTPLEFGDGTEGAPGITWTSESTTGFRRAGTNDQRAVVSGDDKMRWTATGIDMDVSGMWKPLVYEGSDWAIDVSGGTPANGEVPVWSGSSWVPGAAGSSIPNGTAPDQILTWDNTGQAWTAALPVQQIADGTTAGRVLGWNGSGDWVERGAMTVGLNAGDGITVDGTTVTNGQIRNTSGNIQSDTGWILAAGTSGRVKANGASGDVTARSDTYSLVGVTDDLNSPTSPSVRTTGDAWTSGLETTDVQTSPTLDKADKVCVCTAAQYIQEVVDGVDADTLYFVTA